MTSDLTKEIIVGALSVFFTALFAGVPGFALFWWTYQRDQERLVVEKARFRSYADNKIEYGIVIRNRSLFSVHVRAVGFEINGDVIATASANFPNKMKRLPSGTYIIDDTYDPREIPSQASIRVTFYQPDLSKLVTALSRAAKTPNDSNDVFYGPKTIAMVFTETGKRFTSLPPWKRAYRWLVRIKREMDGIPSAE